MEPLSKAAFAFGGFTFVYPIIIGGSILFLFGCIAIGSLLMGLGMKNECDHAIR